MTEKEFLSQYLAGELAGQKVILADFWIYDEIDWSKDENIHEGSDGQGHA